MASHENCNRIINHWRSLYELECERNNELSSLLSNGPDFTAKREICQQRLTELETDLTELTSALNAYKSENSKLNSELTAKQNYHTGLLEQISTNEQLKRELNSLEIDCERFRTELTFTQSQKKMFESEAHQLRSDLQTARQELRNYHENCKCRILPQQPKTPLPVVPSKKSWTCLFCTFENSNVTTHCEICNANINGKPKRRLEEDNNSQILM